MKKKRRLKKWCKNVIDIILISLVIVIMLLVYNYINKVAFDKCLVNADYNTCIKRI